MKKTLENIILVFAAVGLSISLRAQNNAPTQYNEMTIAQLQALMAAGTLTSVDLTKLYLARIAALDQNGTDGGVNSVIELNPERSIWRNSPIGCEPKATYVGPCMAFRC
jgi:hypothetical protein